MTVPFIDPNNPDSVRRAFQKLNQTLGFASEPTFAGFTLTGLTASKLIASDANKTLVSSNLNSWVSGTDNEVDITDDGDGTITIGLVNPLIVGKGGTGVATLTDHGLLLGSGTGAITPLAEATNGQLPIGSTGADPVLAGLTGTANQITVTNGAGSITLSTPQDLDASCDFDCTSVTATGTVQAEQITSTDDMSAAGNLTLTGYADFNSYMSIGDAAAQINIQLHVGKVWDITSAADNTFRKGVSVSLQAGKTGAADYTSHIDGISTQVQLDDVNTQDWTNTFGLRGISIEVNTEGDASGTLTGAVGLLLDSNFQDSMDVTNYYGIYHDAVYDANSKLVNSYGIYLEDFDKATTLNYAIYTNAGIVRFGDAVRIAERSSDPSAPPEGEMVMWMSDGTGYGDDGDVCIAATAGGSTTKAILFDKSAGDAW